MMSTVLLAVSSMAAVIGGARWPARTLPPVPLSKQLDDFDAGEMVVVSWLLPKSLKRIWHGLIMISCLSFIPFMLVASILVFAEEPSVFWYLTYLTMLLLQIGTVRWLAQIIRGMRYSWVTRSG